MKLLLLLTSLVHGLSLEVMRSVIQLSDGHMGMYSAGCPLWPQLQTQKSLYGVFGYFSKPT